MGAFLIGIIWAGAIIIPPALAIIIGFWIYNKIKRNEELKEQILKELKKQNENKE